MLFEQVRRDLDADRLDGTRVEKLHETTRGNVLETLHVHLEQSDVRLLLTLCAQWPQGVLTRDYGDVDGGTLIDGSVLGVEHGVSSIALRDIDPVNRVIVATADRVHVGILALGDIFESENRAGEVVLTIGQRLERMHLSHQISGQTLLNNYDLGSSYLSASREHEHRARADVGANINVQRSAKLGILTRAAISPFQ